MLVHPSRLRKEGGALSTYVSTNRVCSSIFVMFVERCSQEERILKGVMWSQYFLLRQWACLSQDGDKTV